MDKRIGKAIYRNGKMYFDELGWALLKEVAKRTKKSPTYLISRAIERYARTYGQKTQKS